MSAQLLFTINAEIVYFQPVEIAASDWSLVLVRVGRLGRFSTNAHATLLVSDWLNFNCLRFA